MLVRHFGLIVPREASAAARRNPLPSTELRAIETSLTVEGKVASGRFNGSHRLEAQILMAET